MTRTLVLSSYGVRVGIVEAAGIGIGDRLRRVLPPTVLADGTGVPDVHYSVRRSRSPDAAGVTYDVLCGDDVRLRDGTEDEVIEWLRAEIDATVAVRSPVALFIHAGVVGWRGRAIVMPGRSMTGKSTLVAALVRHGATYYSDEFAVLADDGRVHPYARPPVLRDRRMPGSDTFSESIGLDPLPVSLIVSAPFTEGASWAPEAVRGVRAVLPIIDNTLLARVEPQRMLRISALLAPTVVTLQGARPDAEIVAPKILEYLDDLLDGRGRAPAEAPRPQAARDWAQATARAIHAFDRVIPARFLRFDDVLEPDEHALLLEYALAHEPGFEASAVMVSSTDSSVDPRYRASGTLMSLDDLVGGLERRLRALIPYARRELGLPWFPVGRAEIQMAVHQLGDFFGAHVDDGNEAVAGRRLTCVYYFHGRPKRFSGGELRLYDSVERDGRTERAETYRSVEPANNSAVFFPSNRFHEVRPVRSETRSFQDSRFSVNVWFWIGAGPRWE
jgi:2-oxoglutarate-Fe(II)-dependent oxygenase superfamily protein